MTTNHLLISLPHSWLFPQLDAVLHHGGAGTTGASLRGTVFYRVALLPDDDQLDQLAFLL